jgi:hypothetical protein
MRTVAVAVTLALAQLVSAQSGAYGQVRRLLAWLIPNDRSLWVLVWWYRVRLGCTIFYAGILIRFDEDGVVPRLASPATLAKSATLVSLDPILIEKLLLNGNGRLLPGFSPPLA